MKLNPEIKRWYGRTDNAVGNVLIVAGAYWFILPLAGFHPWREYPALAVAGLLAVGVALFLLAQRWAAKNVLWYAWNGFKLLMLYLLVGEFLWVFSRLNPWIWAVLLAAVSLPWLLKQPEWRRDVRKGRF